MSLNMEEQMKNKLRLLFAPLTILSFLLVGIVSGCSSANTVSSADQDNIKTIKTVLEKQFTGPDDKLTQMITSEKNITVIGKDGKVTQPKSPTELETYYEKNYKAYFTEDMYIMFIAADAFKYQSLAHKNGFQLKADNITIKKDKKAKETYEFKVNVICETDGPDQQNAVVSGKVNLSKDGKITSIRYLNDAEFTKVMNH